MKLFQFLSIVFLLLKTQLSNGQQTDSLANSLKALPSKYYSQVDNKINSINKKLTAKSEKYLKKLQRQENRIHKRLLKIDSTSAKYFSFSNAKYNELKSTIKRKTEDPAKLLGGQYNSCLDSLGTSLKFLKDIGNINKAATSLSNVTSLQNKLQESEKIKEFIAERKKKIKETLTKYTNLPGSLKKQYANLSKTAYYYSAQVKEYKDMLNDKKKMEARALAELRKLPAFAAFMKKNSLLAKLFPTPENFGTADALIGLQTRSVVQTQLLQRFGSVTSSNSQSTNSPPVNYLQQQIQQAQGELNKLKDQVNKMGGGSSDVVIPDFKTNNQKTKPFLKRFEYGFNIQLKKDNKYLPSSSDIGASLGYKLNNKSVIGIGVVSKLSFGSINKIQVSSQGLGARSFLDYRIKGQISISGGFEMNYNSKFKNIPQLQNFKAWQSNALVGIKHKYKISKKMFSNVQILYDFLASKHTPGTTPFLFRIGYSYN